MALSGSISKTFHTGYQLRIDWTAVQDIANNTSTITAKMYLKSLGSSYTIISSVGKNAKIIIAGVTYNFSGLSVALNGNQDKFLCQQTVTLTHNADGIKSFTLDGELGIKVTLSGIYYDTIYLDEQTFTLNTIPRASSIKTFNNFTIGNTIPIEINANSSNFKHDINVKLSNGTLIASRTGIMTGGTTSYNLTLTEDEQNVIYQSIPSATSTTVTLYLITKDGSGNIIGNTVSKSVTAYVSSSIVPTISSVEDSDLNEVVSSRVGKYVKTKSKLQFLINASGNKYSNINQYKVIIDGQTITSTSNLLTMSNNFVNSGTLTATITVTDSRGRTATLNKNITVLDYTSPTIYAFIADRCLPDGTFDATNGRYAKVVYNIKVASLMNGVEKNKLTYKIYAKEKNSTDWGNPVIDVTASTGTVSLNTSSVIGGNYELDYSYDFKIVVSDIFSDFGEIEEKIDDIPSAQVALSLSQTGIGVGKIWQQGGLDVEGDTYIRGDLLVRNNNNGYYHINGTRIEGEDTELLRIQRSGDYYTILEVKAPEESPEEATIALMRTGEGYAEFVDFYNMKYGDTPLIGMRIQSRGGVGQLADFLFEFNDGTGVSETMRITPNDVQSKKLLKILSSPDAILEFRNANNNRQGYIGKVTSDYWDRIALVNNNSGMQITLPDYGGMEVYGGGTYYDEKVAILTGHDASYVLNVGGSAKATSWVTTSDRNIKEDIMEFDNNIGYNMLKNIKIYSYKYKDEHIKDNKYRLGVMAQDAPYYIVDYDKDGNEKNTIDIYSFISLLASVTKELQNKVEQLEKEMEGIKNGTISE